jgi:hypothetical protein
MDLVFFTRIYRDARSTKHKIKTLCLRLRQLKSNFPYKPREYFYDII